MMIIRVIIFIKYILVIYINSIHNIQYIKNLNVQPPLLCMSYFNLNHNNNTSQYDAKRISKFPSCLLICLSVIKLSIMSPSSPLHTHGKHRKLPVTKKHRNITIRLVNIGWKRKLKRILIWNNAWDSPFNVIWVFTNPDKQQWRRKGRTQQWTPGNLILHSILGYQT